MLLLLTSLILAVAEPGAIVLDVPYLPQTEALCGGAAAAMVFRHWGDTHAGAQQFATLVDRRAEGISADVLVRTVEARGWRAVQFSGSIDTLRADLADNRPTVILIEDRPNRNHYVVVVGAAADHVIVHDPAWGPFRRIPVADFLRRWRPTSFWALVILPSDARATAGVPTQPEEPSRRRSADPCEPSLARAIDDLQRRGPAEADAILDNLHAQCPASAGPLRELAGIRFAERRWREAASLAGQAIARDPHDEYAWEVLASSRFMQDDVAGALRAWNQIGKPRVDAVQIEGLTRTRYDLVSHALGLPTGSLLTTGTFQRAERRLEQLPDQSSTRLGYRPQPDGFARVEASVVERATHPRGATEWLANTARTLVDRELTVTFPGTTGQGELWTGSWRWWGERPRVAVSFAAPHVGALPGVWHVQASWEAQTYDTGSRGPLAREERVHGGLVVTDWLTADVRYDVRAGVDSWNGTRRAMSIGGLIERRFLADRASIAADATAWMPLTADPGFRAIGLRGGFRSSTAATGAVFVSGGGLEVVSQVAPLALWPGAGDGHARAPLLRAHPLLHDGVVGGSIFGRQLAYAGGELQRWIDSSLPARLAFAGFVDFARASRRAPTAVGDPAQVDVGAGVRLKMAGQKGALRIDFGHGLRDGRHAVTFGWQY